MARRASISHRSWCVHDASLFALDDCVNLPDRFAVYPFAAWPQEPLGRLRFMQSVDVTECSREVRLRTSVDFTEAESPESENISAFTTGGNE